MGIQDIEKYIEIYRHDKDVKIINTQPFIIRIKQIGFKQFKKNLHRPYDSLYFNCMERTMVKLLKNKTIGGCNFGYVHHNVIDLVFNYNESPRNYDLLKGARYTTTLYSSLYSSMATNFFNQSLLELIDEQEKLNENRSIPVDLKKYKELLNKAEFVTSVFNLPKNIIYDYLYLQNNLTTETALIETFLCHFSDKERVGKKNEELVKILEDKGIIIKDQPWRFRFGVIGVKTRDNNKTIVKRIQLQKPLSPAGTKKEPSNDYLTITKVLNKDLSGLEEKYIL